MKYILSTLAGVSCLVIILGFSTPVLVPALWLLNLTPDSWASDDLLPTVPVVDKTEPESWDDDLPPAPVGSKEEMREAMLSPVVKIHVTMGNDKWSGSGFILDKDSDEAWIITARHVVEKADSILVESYVLTERGDGVSLGRFSAHVLEKSNKSDLAMLKVQCRLPGRPVEFATDDEWYNLSVFDEVIMVGCPVGHDPRPTMGIITDVHQERWDLPELFVQIVGEDFEPTIYAGISCLVAPGNSGGPVFANINGTWKVVGVAVASYFINGMLFTHLTSVVPADQVNVFLKSWREKDDNKPVSSDNRPVR